MVRALVLRGALAGVIGGLLAYVFALIFAEPLIQTAIDYEGEREAAQAALEGAGAHEHEAAELFSRFVQGNIGTGVGIVAFGFAVGLFFAVAYCMAYGRAGAIRPRQLALLVALAGFLVLYFVPFLKYPANPPAVGNGDTIAQRAGLFGLMVVASLVFGLLALWAGQRLKPRFGTWNATLLAGLGFVVLIGVVMALLPSLGQLTANIEVSGSLLTETPQPLRDPNGAIVFPGFDADLLYRFRLYSVGAQVILWGAIALVFAPLADRVFSKHGTPAADQMV